MFPLSATHRPHRHQWHHSDLILVTAVQCGWRNSYAAAEQDENNGARLRGPDADTVVVMICCHASDDGWIISGVDYMWSRRGGARTRALADVHKTSYAIASGIKGEVSPSIRPQNRTTAATSSDLRVSSVGSSNGRPIHRVRVSHYDLQQVRKPQMGRTSCTYICLQCRYPYTINAIQGLTAWILLLFCGDTT